MYSCADNADNFMQYLCRVNYIFETYPTPYVYAIGDQGIWMSDYNYLPYAMLSCNEISCNTSDHKLSIDNM